MSHLDQNQNNRKQALFFSTTVQQHFRNKLDNHSDFFNQDQNSKFVLGDILVDAAMCLSQHEDIIKKIQQKYDFNSLIHILDMDDKSFHLLEVVV